MSQKKRKAAAVTLVVFIAASGLVRAGDVDELKKRGVLRHLGVPYANFVTGSGDGMDVELMMLFAKKLEVKYEYVPTTWDRVIGDLSGKIVRPKGDEIEVIGDTTIRGDVISCGLTILPWRQKAIDYGVPVFPTQVWLVARHDSSIEPIQPSGKIAKDIDTTKALLFKKNVLVKGKTCLDPQLYDLETTGAKLVFFKGKLNELAPAVINGEADATLLDVPDTLVALEKWPGQIKVIGPISSEQYMGSAFAKSSPQLREAFNLFLAECIQDGTYERIIKKYYPTALVYFPGFFKDKLGKTIENKK